MPNRDGFIWKDPRPDTHDTACMADCRPASAVRIVSTAEGKSLTPRTTGPLDTALPQ
jgi:cytochrome c